MEIRHKVSVLNAMSQYHCCMCKHIFGVYRVLSSVVEESVKQFLFEPPPSSPKKLQPDSLGHLAANGKVGYGPYNGRMCCTMLIMYMCVFDIA